MGSGAWNLTPQFNGHNISALIVILYKFFQSVSDNLIVIRKGVPGNSERTGGGYVEPLDENLKQLMKELGTAINETLSNSEKISEAIAKIRTSGFDVFLVLEATIGFNKRQEEASQDSAISGVSEGKMQFNITSQDVKFLKSLKISIEDKEAD